MNDKIPHILYSNTLEQLYIGLKEALFTHSAPFSKRIIAVPTMSVKSWIIKKMAADPEIGICAGVEIQLLEHALKKIGTLVGNCPENAYEPSQLQLTLAIESALTQTMKRYSLMQSIERNIWKPIVAYLKMDDSDIKKYSKKIRSLSLSLATIFNEYGNIGQELFENSDEENAWQAALWNQLEEIYAYWNYPKRKLTLTSLEPKKNTYIHLFCVNLLTPLQHQYIAYLSKTLSTHYYVLSPCQKFWGDLLSSKERKKLEKKLIRQGVKQALIEELDDYLTDTNPLLANLSKHGRTQMRLLETLDADIQENFCIPHSVLLSPRYSSCINDELLIDRTTKSPLTLLQALQSDLLFLKNPESEEKLSFQNNNSIQIHAAPKASREVEIVYDLILEAIGKLGVMPENIWVIAPHISEYLPHIHSVFGGIESQIPYTIIDGQSAASNNLVHGFFHFLQIANSKWEATDIIELFDDPRFQRCHRLKAEEIALLKMIVEEGGVHWGRSLNHRKATYGKNALSQSNAGTWELAFNRALEGLTMFDSNWKEDLEPSQFFPFDKITFSQAESLGNLMTLFKSIEQDLLPLEQNQEKSIIEWTQYLKKLFETHFSCNQDEGELEGQKLLMGTLRELNHASEKLKGVLFSADSFLFHLEQQLRAKALNQSESNAQVVRFGSFGNKGPIPSDILIMMGMKDGAYPKLEQIPSFHLMHQLKKNEELHSRFESDKYQFLEQILTVKSRLIITYPYLQGGSPHEHLRCPLINDLLDYLDSAYQINEQKPSSHCIIKHPLLPFHHRYFSPSKELTNYSASYYQAALSYYHSNIKLPPTFLSLFTAVTQKEQFPNVPLVINLSELTSFAKHPLKSYFTKVLGIYIEENESKQSQNEDPIVCSPYLKAALINRSIQYSPEKALEHADKSGHLPNSPFRQLDTTQITEEAISVQRLLATHQINMQDSFVIEFDERFHTPYLEGRCWKLPPLKIDCITLIGRMDNIHASGLLLFAKDTLQKAVEMWPQILTFCCLIDAYSLPFEKNMYFLKEGNVNVKNAKNINSSELLARYISYYLESKNTPSPLLPMWIPSILNGKFDTIQADLDKSNDSFGQADAYLKWINRHTQSSEWKSTLPKWSHTAEQLFLNLATQWYPKALKKQSTSGEDDV